MHNIYTYGMTTNVDVLAQVLSTRLFISSPQNICTFLSPYNSLRRTFATAWLKIVVAERKEPTTIPDSEGWNKYI